MALSEKTLEINICSQLAEHILGKYGLRVFWYGLTQAEEAKRGYDTSFKLGALQVVFQFKAPKSLLTRTSYVRTSKVPMNAGAYVYDVPHAQMQTLLGHVALNPQIGGFYCFPTVFNVPPSNFMLDKALLVGLGGLIGLPPSSRSHGDHRAYVYPAGAGVGTAWFCSDPLKLSASNIVDVVNGLIEQWRRDDFRPSLNEKRPFRAADEASWGGVVMSILPPGAA
ncbi:hypothetical protein ACULL3_00570 [Xanthomonas arboricola pv. corylina]|uniref:hypothetical protein n=1 Tax=Xanthomonas TaxID=338 RepID=UPI0025A305F1|nr:hypothetical protein [Xanthomonas campestris]MDM7876857.1 hypothetical protein [Xanthomonas campestris pv. campestris]